MFEVAFHGGCRHGLVAMFNCSSSCPQGLKARASFGRPSPSLRCCPAQDVRYTKCGPRLLRLDSTPQISALALSPFLKSTFNNQRALCPERQLDGPHVHDLLPRNLQGAEGQLAAAWFQVDHAEAERLEVFHVGCAFALRRGAL